MLRRAFLRRMAFAALATWFVDLPLPKREPPSTVDIALPASVDAGDMFAWEYEDMLWTSVTVAVEPQSNRALA